MTAQSRLTATEQVCLEAIQERDRALARLERVEGERDRYREGLRQIVEFPTDEERSAGWHFAEVRHIARSLLAPAVPARQMTLEYTKGGGANQ